MAKKVERDLSFEIKIPVYSSELIGEEQGLFAGPSYHDMIRYVHNKISTFQENLPKISKNKRNKLMTTEVADIKYFDFTIGPVPVVLVQVSAYNTNLLDGYVETEKKITLQQDHKLGSDNNFFLLYPRILGLDPNTFQRQWLVFVYEDPNKENSQLVGTVKLVLKKIFDISTVNIKLSALLETLREIGTIQELNLKFTSMIHNENEIDVKLRPYLVESKLQKKRDEYFENVPFNETEEIISESENDEEYQKKEIRFKVGRREYKFTRERKEAEEKIKETVEEIFNTRIAIKKADLNNLYKPEYIMEKMIPVVQSYLSDNG